jgi:non-specific serine/threonine protein kinase
MTFLDKKRFAEALQYNHFYNLAGWKVTDEGRSLFDKEQVTVDRYTDSTFECTVRGKLLLSNHVKAEMKGTQLLYSCDCKDGQRGAVCKHLIAAAMAVQKVLNEEIKKSWENRLLFVNTPHPRKPAPPKASEYLLLFALYPDYNNLWKVRPLTAPLEKLLAAGVEPPVEWNNENLMELLARNHVARGEFSSEIKHPFKPETCLNAPTQIVHLAQMLYQMGSNVTGYYTVSGPEKATPGVLETLRDEKFPLYLGQAGYGSNFVLGSTPAEILNDQANVLLEIENHKDGGLRLQFHLYLGSELWKVTKKPTVITQNPLWLLLDDKLIPASQDLDVEQIENLSKASRVIIPPEEKEHFLTEYVPRLADQFTITGAGVNTRDVVEKTQPRLYLSDNAGTLEVALKFGYGEFEVPFESRIPVSTASYDLETVTFTRIIRNAEAEKSAHAKVSDYGLKRATGSPGLFNLRAKVDVVDFLVRHAPKATADGFEIYGQDNIKNVRVNRHTPTISFNISSGIDWFDLQTTIQYGDVSVPLKEMRRALKRNENYIMLADGSIGEVPQEWLERYKHVFGLGEENGEDALRFSNQQVTLLDQLMGESERVSTDEEFQRRRQRLRDFESIVPQPLPEKLNAELRPYQKAGVDWLHFLREYQFGGCLADDMGLGKTVQVLAFLQALKEKQAPAKASLVVLPRSLLVNWQRESEKFTPELRMLEYHGQFREKDASLFDQYDIILTTYGIVIKDIELLRAYRFNYVILDESQAIKNPVSQSAKGCRLLEADHRLVMTGTPVENSTMELWSQFAFLNPGLLGNLEYFKSEIGGPIERDANADTAQFLRKMVYPFILRRTKEQVAPELPPRTERIIYGDMEPAQRKIYVRTREEYRKSLLGLIDGQGMENARMKILEGLLRLRQICIHPRLVDKAYHGESAKFELLTEHIDTLMSEGHKALIFSQFVETLKLLRADLDARKIRYAYLDGSTNNRQEQVDAFQTDAGIPFFLISLKAGGVGLNLTAADYVIHIDPWWNPAVEMQASDRVHRIGQDKPVFVYKYILRDSVEEKILLLQERKRNLVDQLITTDTSFFKSITKEDVKALFS